MPIIPIPNADKFPIRDTWEAISHVIEANVSLQGEFQFEPLKENTEFLIQEIQLWSNITLTGRVSVAIGSKTYICDLPVVLCQDKWHSIATIPLRVTKNDNCYGWLGISGTFKATMFLKGILYRKM